MLNYIQGACIENKVTLIHNIKFVVLSFAHVAESVKQLRKQWRYAKIKPLLSCLVEKLTVRQIVCALLRTASTNLPITVD